VIESRTALLQSIRISNELIKRRARTEMKTFVQFIKPDYVMRDFHAYICQKLDAFARGEIKKMMILLPVQHGKSELASRHFPSLSLWSESG
jgi:hypothetical protein